MSTIFKNWHYSLPMIPWITSTRHFRRAFVFTDSCRYNLQSKDQSDWNKLTGFTFGLSLRGAVHNNSIRIAWRYDEVMDKIRLCWYAYRNGQRFYDEQNTWCVDIGKVVYIHIFQSSLVAGKYLVFINGYKRYVDQVYSGLSSYGWLCFPYFGGNRKAPHTMVIHRKKYRQ